MNLKIVLAVCIAFAITFTSLYLAINIFDNSERIDYKNQFYSKQFQLNENKILLIGSSHIGHLNMSHVINKIENENLDFTIYNLADNGDSPKFRYDELSQIISLEPELVFYGISYRDFNQLSELSNSQRNDFTIKNSLDDLVPEELKSINPQLLTRKVIRDVLDDSGIIKKPTYEIKPKNTPFFSLGDLQTKISHQNELKRQLLTVLPDPKKIQIESQNNEEIEKFHKILRELQSEGISVIIFTTPINPIYLDEIKNSTKILFNDELKNISEEYDIKIYDFENNYADLEIWNNLDHIAYNKKSIIFSDDIANMVIKETIP